MTDDSFVTELNEVAARLHHDYDNSLVSAALAEVVRKFDPSVKELARDDIMRRFADAPKRPTMLIEDHYAQRNTQTPDEGTTEGSLRRVLDRLNDHDREIVHRALGYEDEDTMHDDEFPDEHQHNPDEPYNSSFHVMDEEGRHYLLSINLTDEGMILDLYDRYGEQVLGSWARTYDEVGQMVYEQDPQNVVPQTTHPLFDEVMSVLIARGVLTTKEAGRLSRDQHIIDRFWESDIGPMIDDVQEQIVSELRHGEYEVSVSANFTATSKKDAIMQMAAWLDDSSYEAGYRVNGPDGTSEFIDAETIDYDAINTYLEDNRA